MNPLCGRLDRFQVIEQAYGADVLVAGHDLAIRHASTILAARLEPNADWNTWDGQFRLSRAVMVWEEEVLQLLTEAVIMQPPEAVSVAFALDWYRQGEDGEGRPLTRIGRMLHDSKYWRDSDLRYLGGWEHEIARSLAQFIARHQLYLRAHAIIATPGSGVGRGYSDRIAMKTSALTRHPLFRPTAMTPNRPKRKSGAPFDLTNEFSLVPEELSGKVVIVIDDLIQQGDTMRAMALAARRAGAKHVLGLGIARTFRNTPWTP
jgi:hypothetical protein